MNVVTQSGDGLDDDLPAELGIVTVFSGNSIYWLIRQVHSPVLFGLRTFTNHAMLNYGNTPQINIVGEERG